MARKGKKRTKFQSERLGVVEGDRTTAAPPAGVHQAVLDVLAKVILDRIRREWVDGST